MRTDPPYANSDPVLKVGSYSDWDANRVFDHWVMHSDRGYEMWYTGISSNMVSIGYATSVDGISWTKWPENPILRTSPAWGMGYVTCCVLEFDDYYHLWYASYKSNNYTEIGYMISKIGTDVETAKTATQKPVGFKLEKNYPNPFNSETVITYKLPASEHVTLEILNIVGQKVRTLVDEHQSAGHYLMNWDGKNNEGQGVLSGIYIYKIIAGSFEEVKKMTVLR